MASDENSTHESTLFIKALTRLSCKAMGIDTRDYLTHLFMNAGSLSDNDRKPGKTCFPENAMSPKQSYTGTD
ncbi:MAG: hypothetical protein IJ831_05600 [Spirochaetales bacterium]|nr:hypothetical protein [Spirochaetales bacterium]